MRVHAPNVSGWTAPKGTARTLCGLTVEVEAVAPRWSDLRVTCEACRQSALTLATAVLQGKKAWVLDDCVPKVRVQDDNS